MKFIPTLIISFLLITAQLTAQEKQIDNLSELAAVSVNWIEGFQKNIGEHQFSYGSFRNDVRASLISRCKQGETTIEWETAVVPENIQQKEVGFLWIAAIDLTTEKQVFDIYFNDQKRFEFTTSNQKTRKVESSDGGTLFYTTVETDQHGDAHGYMSIVVPISWIKKGEAQKIKIAGRANKSNAWIIVYQAKDALSHFRNSMKYNVSMTLTIEEKGKKLIAQITAPLHFSGETLSYSSGEKEGTIKLKRSGETSTAEFTLPVSAKNKKFELHDSNGELFIVNSLGGDFNSTKILAKTVLLIESKKEGDRIVITTDRKYNSKTANSLLKLSGSVLNRGTIYLMNSSHQDIAWMDSPEKCILERDTMLLSPLFEMAQKDENYRFDVEDALMIKEFIERHPGKKGLVREMLKSGRISCGSTFTQPYEEMYSGEALARQFYFGAKWLEDEFDYTANVYWNEDVPGRTLQMMQLMRKAGTKYLMISRFEQGLFNWYSPDGSYVTLFSPGHYGNAFLSLQKSFYEAAQFLATSSLYWEKYYTSESNSPVIPLLSDWDMSPAIDHSNLISQWEAVDELPDKNGRPVPVKLPKIRISSAPEFFNALTKENPELPTITGERPAVWLYIHGPSHQKALKASREADILLTQAEKFATANAMVDNSFENYPVQKLKKAWEAKIYPDHGWGGKHGDITDALFKQKFEFAKVEAEEVLNKNLNELSSKIETDNKKGRPLVVFNSMDNEREDPVSVGIRFDEPGVFSVVLSDASGEKTETQLSDITNYPDGSVKSATLHFIAKQVPAIGYKTWYLKTSSKKNSANKPKFENEYENQFYSLKFGDGGVSSIFDKELNRELIDSGKFKAGEVFTMHSEGNGAGEFADIQKPDMKGFDKTGNYKTKWVVEESGAIFTTIKFRQKIKNAVVEQKVKIYNNQKRVDFETALLNWEGVLYREYRMALPLNMTDGQVAYEVPFGVVEVGKDEMIGAAGERYSVPCKDMHPRGIENWISASNSDFGVTMSSTVVVADWIDPTDNPVKNQMLQPVLLASRRSCHWEGNDYLQTGDHHFRFSITSHKQDWKNGMNQARGANETLKAVWADKKYADASLPEELSFFNTGDPDVFISTIKKAEDSNDVVVRLVNMIAKDKKVALKSFRKIEDATLTNLIEEDIKPISTNKSSIQIELGHHAIETIKLK